MSFLHLDYENLIRNPTAVKLLILCLKVENMFVFNWNEQEQHKVFESSLSAWPVTHCPSFSFQSPFSA